MAAAFAAPSAVAVRRPAAAATTTARPAAPLGTCAFTPAAGAARLAAAVARRAGFPPPPTGPTAPVCDGTVTFPSDLDGTKLRVGIVSARWRDDLTGPMVADVLKGLAERSVKDDNIVQMEVPGCGELPVAARLMMATQKVDVVIAVGVLIDGATDGYTFMCEAVSNGLMNLQLTAAIPVIFGVLTCNTPEQAEARATGDKSHAVDWAATAVEMGVLRSSQIGNSARAKASVGFS